MLSGDYTYKQTSFDLVNILLTELIILVNKIICL